MKIMKKNTVFLSWMLVSVISVLHSGSRVSLRPETWQQVGWHGIPKFSSEFHKIL